MVAGRAAMEKAATEVEEAEAAITQMEKTLAGLGEQLSLLR